MEKVKKLASLLIEENSKVEELTEKQIEKLKSKVHKLLQTYLPADKTVGEVETLLVVIVSIITEPNEYLNPLPNGEE